MTITVPKIYEDLKLKDSDAIIVTLMMLISDEYGFNNYYNFCQWDFNKIYHKSGGNINDNSFKNLRNIFDIIYLNDENFMIRFKNLNKKDWYSNQPTKNKEYKLRTYAHKLTQVRNQNLWCYLFGKFMGALEGSLVENTDELFPHAETSHGFSMKEKYQINLRIENRAKK